MNAERLNELLSKFADCRVAVLGDLFLDKFLIIDRQLDEPSLETGLTAWQVVGKRIYAGAAGTVLNNISAMGAGKLYAISAIGDDGEGYELCECLRSIGADMRYLIRSKDVCTPTYTKPMHLMNGRETEGNRLDFVNVAPTPESIVNGISRALDEAVPHIDALIVLDQVTREDTGVVSAAIRDKVAAIARENPELIVFADSRAFINRFRDVIIKCNDKEATEAVYGYRPEEFEPEVVKSCFSELRERTGCAAFITCGERGVCVGHTIVPAVKLDCEIDICGCGDACSAGIVLALCSGASGEEAAMMGNLAASVTACKIGMTGTATQAEIREQFARHFA